MTIRQLFEQIRELPDWDAEILVRTDRGVYKLMDSTGVGDTTGNLYLTGEVVRRFVMEDIADK